MVFHVKVMELVSTTLNEQLQGTPIKFDANRAALKEL